MGVVTARSEATLLNQPPPGADPEARSRARAARPPPEPALRLCRAAGGALEPIQDAARPRLAPSDRALPRQPPGHSHGGQRQARDPARCSPREGVADDRRPGCSKSGPLWATSEVRIGRELLRCRRLHPAGPPRTCVVFREADRPLARAGRLGHGLAVLCLQDAVEVLLQVMGMP